MDLKRLVHKFFWSFVYVILLTSAMFIVWTLWRKFLGSPTITTLISSTYPVSRVPFPAVSICSLNRISKERAYEMAEELANATNSNVDEIMTRMRFFGQLHDFDFDASTVTELLEFQKILDSLHITVNDVVKRLTPSCEELLRSCYWKSVEVDCLSLFTTRLTFQGYCCVFNYVKKTREIKEENKKQEPVTTEAGVENGIHVSVNNNIDDYFYSTMSSFGVIINIFVPTEYPDINSGSLIEVLTTPDSENFVEIIPTTLKSAEDVIYYPVSTRKCLFHNERNRFGLSLTGRSDCNLVCKIISIQSMCECVPFFIPWTANNSVCTLADIPCLNRYKDKWSSLYPEESTSPVLLKEKQHSLRCDEKCYSSCSETFYKVQVTAFPAYNKSREEGNITRINVYYLNRFSALFLQDMTYHWFEIISNFGGVFGIFLGWSMISAIQLSLYYVEKIIMKLLK